jgi:hypothetical protein
MCLKAKCGTPIVQLQVADSRHTRGDAAAAAEAAACINSVVNVTAEKRTLQVAVQLQVTHGGHARHAAAAAGLVHTPAVQLQVANCRHAA